MIDNKLKPANHKHCYPDMHLPIHTDLPDGQPVVIEAMTDSQITQMYKLILQSALNGNGFGVDEYPTETHFRAEIQDGHNFVLSSKESGKLLAAVSIITSHFYRGTDLTLADPIIIVKRSERGKGVGEFLFKYSISLAKKLGFSGMYVDTFSNNLAMTKIIERTPGFQHVGYLPVGGQMADGAIVGSNIYFRDFREEQEEGIV